MSLSSASLSPLFLSLSPVPLAPSPPHSGSDSPYPLIGDPRYCSTVVSCLAKSSALWNILFELILVGTISRMIIPVERTARIPRPPQRPSVPTLFVCWTTVIGGGAASAAPAPASAPDPSAAADAALLFFASCILGPRWLWNSRGASTRLLCAAATARARPRGLMVVTIANPARLEEEEYHAADRPVALVVTRAKRLSISLLSGGIRGVSAVSLQFSFFVAPGMEQITKCSIDASGGCRRPGENGDDLVPSAFRDFSRATLLPSFLACDGAV